jgi:amino acid transporter
MNEKFSVGRWFAAILIAVATVIAIAIAIATAAVPSTTASATAPAPAPPADTEPAPVPDTAQPPTTSNDFFPEERDLTSCIGALERPGCGSESRGGWRQTLVLLAIFAGLAVIFTNVVRGIRRNRSD